MTRPRSVLLAAAAGLLAAGVLLLLNVAAGPQVCVSPPICAPPLPGESGCGPVPTTCGGQLLSIQAIASISIGAALLIGLVLGIRRRG